MFLEEQGNFFLRGWNLQPLDFQIYETKYVPCKPGIMRGMMLKWQNRMFSVMSKMILKLQIVFRELKTVPWIVLLIFEDTHTKLHQQEIHWTLHY